MGWIHPDPRVPFIGSSIIARPLVIGPVKQRSVTKKESRRSDSRRGV